MAIDLFDAQYYAAANRDLAAAGIDTEAELRDHFQRFGLLEGRKFSAFVNLDYYRNSYSDLENFNYADLLNHLQNSGVREGRRFTQAFDLKYYLANNADLNQAFGGDEELAFQHLITQGINENRVFLRGEDRDFLSNYLTLNPDVSQSVWGSLEGALEHLITYGFAEGRPGSQESFGAYSADLQVVRQMYEALGRGDFTTSFKDLLTEDTVWTFTGDTSIIPFAGEWEGRDGVLEFFSKRDEAVTSNLFEIRGFFAGESQIVSLLHEDLTVKETGSEYVVDVYNLITVRDGQVSRLEGVFDSAISEAAFLGENSQVAQARDIDALTGMRLARSPNAAVTPAVAQPQNTAQVSDSFDDSGVFGLSGAATVQPYTGVSDSSQGVSKSFEPLLQTAQENVLQPQELFLQPEPMFSV
ncbi:MAG: nuclear transport factor 2 family protein [Oscillatoria princeps RMCB-10]|nr:nuclear transport factor 2 family protein [Oscillatoria princeps RMCB-10]